MCSIQEKSYNCGIAVSDLLSSSQKEEFCFARYICWRCLYRNEKKSLQSIGKAYNRKSHTTIISGIRAIDNMESANDPKYRKLMQTHRCFNKEICTNEQLEYYI